MPGMGELYTRFDNVFFEKTRLSLMTLLYREEKAPFQSLKKRMNLSDGALYSHLEKLIRSGYAAKEKELAGDTVQTVYQLTDDGKKIFMDYIKFLQGVLENEEVR